MRRTWGIVLGLLASACGGGAEEVGVALNWSISVPGSTTGVEACLAVEATTVEWRVSGPDVSGDDDDVVMSYACVDTGQHVLLEAGVYHEVTARLLRGDGVVLASCDATIDSPLSPSANRVDTCDFEAGE